MGELQSTPNHQQSYLQNLNHVETNNDTPFGHVDVYRMKQSPYQYIVSLRKHFVSDYARSHTYVHMMNKLRQLQHRNLSKIHHCEETEQIQVCIKTRRILTFHSYYNFTLQQAIEKRKLKQQTFCQNELIYVLGSLLDLALYLKNYNISIGEYRCQSIFLSPQGHLKLYLNDFQPQNGHSCFRRAIEDKTLIQQFILAPQQLYQIKHMDEHIKYDVYKSDVFAIAMVILELITLEKSKYYYTDDYSALKTERIAFTLSNYSAYFSSCFIKLMKICLQPNPSNRCSLQTAFQQLKHLRRNSKNVAYCIKLQQQDISKRQSLRKSFSIPLKSQFLVNSLEKKLTVPLKTTHKNNIFDRENTSHKNLFF